MPMLRGSYPTDIRSPRRADRIACRYVWRVIADPSEGQPFLGRLFRLQDVTAGGFIMGTQFEHINTGEIRPVINSKPQWERKS